MGYPNLSTDRWAHVSGYTYRAEKTLTKQPNQSPQATAHSRRRRSRPPRPWLPPDPGAAAPARPSACSSPAASQPLHLHFPSRCRPSRLPRPRPRLPPDLGAATPAAGQPRPSACFSSAASPPFHLHFPSRRCPSRPPRPRPWLPPDLGAAPPPRLRLHLPLLLPPRRRRGSPWLAPGQARPQLPCSTSRWRLQTIQKLGRARVQRKPQVQHRARP